MNNISKYNYTQEEIEYLKQIIKGNLSKDIIKLYNDKFNKQMTYNQLVAFQKKYNVWSGKYSSGKKCTYNFTNEESEYLKSIIVGKLSKEIIELYKQKFNKNLSYRELIAFERRNNIKSGVVAGLFESGNFKNPKPPKPIGYEMVCKDKSRKSGKRIKVKVGNKKWVEKSRYIYEKYYGEIPKGYWIYHLDGNVSNNSIDNLIALERSIVVSLNITGLKSIDKDLTKLGIDILKINRKIKERKKEMI